MDLEDVPAAHAILRIVRELESVRDLCMTLLAMPTVCAEPSELATHLRVGGAGAYIIRQPRTAR